MLENSLLWICPSTSMHTSNLKPLLFFLLENSSCSFNGLLCSTLLLLNNCPFDFMLDLMMDSWKDYNRDGFLGVSIYSDNLLEILLMNWSSLTGLICYLFSLGMSCMLGISRMRSANYFFFCFSRRYCRSWGK